MKSLKKLAIAAIPALAFSFAAASTAQAQDIQCAPEEALTQALSQQFGDVATDEKGSDGVWDLELFADKTDGSWSIVGKPKVDGAPEGIACYLGGADEGYPDQVKEMPWYKSLFAPKP